MGLDELDARDVRYAIVDAKTGDVISGKLTLKKDLFMKFVSLVYFLSMRVHEEPKEIDIATTESKHILLYPYSSEEFLVIFVEKNSDYLYIKQNISSILRR